MELHSRHNQDISVNTVHNYLPLPVLSLVYLPEAQKCLYQLLHGCMATAMKYCSERTTDYFLSICYYYLPAFTSCLTNNFYKMPTIVLLLTHRKPFQLPGICTSTSTLLPLSLPSVAFKPSHCTKPTQHYFY